MWAYELAELMEETMDARTPSKGLIEVDPILQRAQCKIGRKEKEQEFDEDRV